MGLTFLYIVLYFFAVIASVGFGLTSFYALPLLLSLFRSLLLACLLALLGIRAATTAVYFVGFVC